LLNGEPVKEPARLRPGDQIQIGYTGVTLVVVDFELPPHSSAGDRGVELRKGVALATGLIACLLLISSVLPWPRGSGIEPYKTSIAVCGLIACLLPVGILYFWPRRPAAPAKNATKAIKSDQGDVPAPKKHGP
jgi:hypothetical protein